MDSFSEIPTRASLDATERDGALPCLGLVCLSCGFVSQHAVRVFSGELANKWAESE